MCAIPPRTSGTGSWKEGLVSPGHCTDHVRQNPPGSLGRWLCRVDSDGMCPHTSWVICTWVPPPIARWEMQSCCGSSSQRRAGYLLPAASTSFIVQGGNRGNAVLGTHLSFTGLGWEPRCAGLLPLSCESPAGSPCTLPKPQVGTPTHSGLPLHRWCKPVARVPGSRKVGAFLLVLFREQHASN